MTLPVETYIFPTSSVYHNWPPGDYLVKLFTQPSLAHFWSPGLFSLISLAVSICSIYALFRSENKRCRTAYFVSILSSLVLSVIPPVLWTPEILKLPGMFMEYGPEPTATLQLFVVVAATALNVSATILAVIAVISELKSGSFKKTTWKSKVVVTLLPFAYIAIGHLFLFVTGGSFQNIVK